MSRLQTSRATCADIHAADATALIKHSDIAMYAAKQAGKNTCRFYSSGPAANDPRSSDSKSA